MAKRQMRAALVFTCEHGGARIPARYAHLFRSNAARAALASHRGSDIGALDVARRLSKAFDAPLLSTTVSRLLVDTNRSEGHPHLFSEFSRSLNVDERERVLARHYRPHREQVATTIEAIRRRGRAVLHFAIHSFTPIWNGAERVVDVGVLYDPRRSAERALCAALTETLRSAFAGQNVRKNSPYRGNADGLTTALRVQFPTHYVGVELELKQSLLARAEERQAMSGRIESGLDSVHTMASSGL